MKNFVSRRSSPYWGGTDPREPVFDAKTVLELAPNQQVQHGIRLQAVYDSIIV